MSPDGKKTLLASDQSIEAVSFLHGLIYSSRVALPNANSLVNGKVAMLHEGTWLMQEAWSHVDIGIAEPMTHRKQATHVHINRFGISSTSKQPDLAWEWIKFMMEPANLQLVLAESRAFPPRVSTLRISPYNQDPRWQQWLTAAVLAVPVPGYVPELAEIVGYYDAALRDIFNNKTPVRSRLESMAQAIENNVLKRGK